jgi:uncharacterized linocin/CFP29 family protein
VIVDLLKRELAPILGAAWNAIDSEARRVLALNLAGRKIVDFDGPHGWNHAAVNTGRLAIFEREPIPQVSAGLRSVQPLVELRTPMRLAMMELDTIERGAADFDLEEVVSAAERIAMAEDRAIFHGWPDARIPGIVPSSPHTPVVVQDVVHWPRAILDAKEVLRRAGVDGPYALALGPKAHEDLYAASEDGYPIVKRIERTILDGPIVRAPGLDGAVLLSARGGDFALTVGQDFSIGYADRDRAHVELYITESFTFRVLEARAAVHLRHG